MPLRRAIAVGIAVVLVALAFGMDAASRESFESDARLVATQPHLSAPLVDVRNCRRACTEYVVAVDGREIVLDNDGALHDPRIGAAVRYVVDPEDPDRAIAVGEPEDWIPDHTGDLILLVFFVAVALGTSAWVAYKFLPEDVERLRR